jgi:hypothetical protein
MAKNLHFLLYALVTLNLLGLVPLTKSWVSLQCPPYQMQKMMLFVEFSVGWATLLCRRVPPP